MSHRTGTIVTAAPAFVVGPATGPGTTSVTFSPPASPEPGGTKLLVLHFTGVALPGGSRLEVDLGYGTDVFTAADGADFWTRPVNVFALPGGVTMRLVATAAGAVARIEQYGRGERHAGKQDPTSLSNCDPFLGETTYTEPKYDPFWFCTQPPDWDNVRCVPPGDIRRDVAASVGMILHADDEGFLSTCTVTLVEPDLVVTAGHCVTSPAADAASGSIIFGYQTECDGSRPAGYAPLVVKCKEVIAQRWDGVHDYCLIRLKVPVGGLGIPPRQLRHDLPGVGEKVFGLHHPNGAVMKLSLPRASWATVTARSDTSVNVPIGFDVSGGSSGSALFDAAGRVVGVLSNGSPCAGSPLRYYPVATMLGLVAQPPPPPIQRAVVLVMDRSGSMNLPGQSGRRKIEEARDAASLFVQLVRAGTGSKVGMVSFSTTSSSPADEPLLPVTVGTKAQLVGPPPYVTGVIGSLTPGGATSIGAGLASARTMLSTPDGLPHSILLLTDGLQNTTPWISDVDGSLAGIDIQAIGYGTPGSLDGAVLTALASGHGGSYVRADSTLRLEKFFAQAFGAIFESGLLQDPEYDLAEDAPSGTAMPFDVCGEEAVTVVAGWDDTHAGLALGVTTPNGVLVSTASPGVVTDRGLTWQFIRIPLPYAGERDGTWTANVFRPGGGEFPAGGPALRYFLSVVAAGGPQLRRVPQPVRFYTGDTVNPLVHLGYDTGGAPEGASVALTVSGPGISEGTFLSAEGLAAPLAVDGDTIPGRQTTILAKEQTGSPPVVHGDRLSVNLGSDPADLRGSFEPAGLFGKELPDLLVVEGDYTFHAVATYGDGCVARRETLWSVHVDVGIDPDATSTTVIQTGTSGSLATGVLTVTPKDRFGNLVGPGKSDGFGVGGAPGTSVTGPATDNGDGTYDVPVTWDPSAGTPGIIVDQPGRPAVQVPPPTAASASSAGCLPWLLLAAVLIIVVLIVLLVT